MGHEGAFGSMYVHLYFGTTVTTRGGKIVKGIVFQTRSPILGTGDFPILLPLTVVKS